MKKSFIIIALFVFSLALAACATQVSTPAPESTTPPRTESVDPTVEPATPPAEEETAAAIGDTGTLRLEERPCDLFIPAGEVEGETIQCGYAIVPALREQPDSQPVKLAYVILKATGDDPVADPIVHIAGGPGAASTSRDAVLEFIRRYAPMREDRDIILYDQRGMGRSEPFFDCTQFLGDSTDFSALDNDTKLIAACQKAMDDQGYPPEAFSTPVSAADLMDLMTVLDYPEYNLYGISYGTRLLMSLMHHFPQEAPVRAVILDSVDTLPEDVGNDLTGAGQLLQQDMFESVFAACAGDETCAADYPDLRAQFDALTEQLDQNPIQLDEYTTVDGDTIYRYTFPYNGAIQNIPYQPRMLLELSQGVFEPKLLLVEQPQVEIDRRLDDTGAQDFLIIGYRLFRLPPRLGVEDLADEGVHLPLGERAHDQRPGLRRSGGKDRLCQVGQRLLPRRLYRTAALLLSRNIVIERKVQQAVLLLLHPRLPARIQPLHQIEYLWIDGIELQRVLAYLLRLSGLSLRVIDSGQGQVLLQRFLVLVLRQIHLEQVDVGGNGVGVNPDGVLPL